MARFLHGLGKFVVHRKWVVIGAWVLAALAVVVLVRSFGSNTSDNLELPGTDSQAATDLLAERFPPQQNGSSPVVFHVGPARSRTRRQAGDEDFTRWRCPRRLQPTRSASGRRANQQGQVTAFILALLNVGGDELTDGWRR
jgi:hypothetical protein